MEKKAVYKTKANKEGVLKPKTPKPPLRPTDKRIGNQFWKFRAKHGRDKLFATPELLWEAACEYFQWCEDNPLYEARPFAYQGEVIVENMPKMRAMTMSGLCFFLHCDESYFRKIKAEQKENDDGYFTIITDIEKIIYNQKFQGAAADLLNANIIARELGLSDKQTHEVDGLTGITVKIRKADEQGD